MALSPVKEQPALRAEELRTSSRCHLPVDVSCLS